MTNNRKPNIKPTSAHIKSAWVQLRLAAEAGDVQACASLIELDMLDKQQAKADEEDAARIGAIVAAHVPKDLWHHFPLDVQVFAEDLTEAVTRIVQAGGEE